MVLVSGKDAVSAFPIKRSLAHTPFEDRFDVKTMRQKSWLLHEAG